VQAQLRQALAGRELKIVQQEFTFGVRCKLRAAADAVGLFH
jgi:hypothetical protein